MSSNSRLLVTFNFHIMFISSSSLHMCLIRYPQIPMETMAAIFGYLTPLPPCLCNWSGNQVFLNFHSKSLVPTLAIGDNQKWREPWEWGCVHHRLTCFTCMLNLPDVHGFPPFRQRTWKECLFLNFFFITLTLFCSTVKLTKLKYTC